MDSIGIDVHKNESQICVLTEAGELLEQRIRTNREQFRKTLGKTPRARILIEASTESEWVARFLEELGHEVIVADPNYGPMYANPRRGRIKTDRRDARGLAEACRRHVYRTAHRASEQQRRIRAELAVRDALVRTRCRYISVVRALLRREGFHIQLTGSAYFPRHVADLDLPDYLLIEISSLMTLIVSTTVQLDGIDARLRKLAEEDENVRRLCSVPGIGPVISVSFVAAVDQVERFRGPHQLEAYLGLVPREWSSGDRHRKGSITKAGSSRVRHYLVEASWNILRYKKPETARLCDWAERVAARRGRSVAAVALARRLAGILYAMWRDGTVFDSRHERKEQEEVSMTA